MKNMVVEGGWMLPQFQKWLVKNEAKRENVGSDSVLECLGGCCGKRRS